MSIKKNKKKKQKQNTIIIKQQKIIKEIFLPYSQLVS